MQNVETAKLKPEHTAILRRASCVPVNGGNYYKCRYSTNEAAASWWADLCPAHRQILEALLKIEAGRDQAHTTLIQTKNGR